MFIAPFIFHTCTCPPCEVYPEGLRLIFLDNDGHNILASDSIQIKNVRYCEGVEIDFSSKDYIIPHSIEKYHVELATETFFKYCFDQTCSIFLEFSDGKVDTINYRIDVIQGKGCGCDTYHDSVLLYNGNDYIDNKENTIGAYEILK